MRKKCAKRTTKCVRYAQKKQKMAACLTEQNQVFVFFVPHETCYIVY